MTNLEIPTEHYHYIEAVNKGMTDGSKIMLVLHGRGDTLHSYKVLVKEINVTGLNYLLLNAPFTEFFGYTWYDDSFDLEDKKYQQSLKVLDHVLNQIEEQGFAPEDIFLFGFSQGGRMVMDSFLQRGKRLGGVIALSPRVTAHENLEVPESIQDTPLFFAHGINDEVIPIEETTANLKQWEDLFSNFRFEEYDMAHEIDIMEIVALREWLNEYL